MQRLPAPFAAGRARAPPKLKPVSTGISGVMTLSLRPGGKLSFSPTPMLPPALPQQPEFEPSPTGGPVAAAPAAALSPLALGSSWKSKAVQQARLAQKRRSAQKTGTACIAFFARSVFSNTPRSAPPAAGAAHCLQTAAADDDQLGARLAWR